MKIILSVLFLVNAVAHAQSGKNCKVLSAFLNSREVSESFRLPESKDSIIMIALGSTEWGACRGFDWNGRVIKQSNDTNELANATNLITEGIISGSNKGRKKISIRKLVM